MKALIEKDLRLCLHPMCYLAPLFVLMLLIPSYPFFVAFFYTTLAVFFLFLSGRENGDVLFSALLPADKARLVRARTVTVAGLELIVLVLAVPMAILRARLLGPEMGANSVGTDAGAAFFGLAAVQYGIFNLIFLPGFYKTARNAGGPFLVAGIVEFLYITAVEVSMHVVPYCRDVLDSALPEKQAAQLPVLAGGLVLAALFTLLGCRLAEKRFEKVDL